MEPRRRNAGHGEGGLASSLMQQEAFVAFDVTPLQNAHRYRGIGTYVRGLASRLVAQTEIPIEFWGWTGDGQLEVPPPHRAVWLPKRPTPQYRGAWIFAQLALRQRAG